MRTSYSKAVGFTLIEVMVVIFIMGIAASAVVLNFSSESPEQALKKQTQRTAVIFNMASDFAVLNQRQLGLRVDQESNSYYFMALNEEQEWVKLDQDKIFEEHTLPESFSLSLSLTDLPWEDDNNLFSSDGLDEELSLDNDRVEIGQEEEKKLDPPQIFIFSSGEITPFSLALSYEPEFSRDLPVHFRLNGQDSIPLIIEGPLDALN
jgi:general secretion pathway protein H